MNATAVSLWIVWHFRAKFMEPLGQSNVDQAVFCCEAVPWKVVNDVCTILVCNRLHFFDDYIFKDACSRHVVMRQPGGTGLNSKSGVWPLMQCCGGNGSGEEKDIKIIARILGGRINDFELLLERYRGYVFKIVSGILPVDAVADLCHEVFVEIYKSLPQYQERTTFKKWVAGIAIHLCYDYWREHYRNREIPVSSLTEDHQKWVDGAIVSQADNIFAGVESQKEAREVLQWAMAGLSAEDRMVLTLVHLEGLSVKEVATALGWSSINVKVRAHRSREKMRKRIATLLEGDR